jgi:hypothetical protein
VTGGSGNIASGTEASVSGGFSNVDGGLDSSVSGGRNIFQGTTFGWSAGSESAPATQGNFRSP